MLVVFITDEGVFEAYLDIPAQSLYDYVLSEASFDGTHIYFEGFKEANRLAVWDGELQDDGTISGEFAQLGYTGTFNLAPVEMAAEDIEPLPYTEEEVEFQNGEITLSGTLTIPEGDGPHPVFILISGSGAQNRDEEIFGFKIFGIIADHLTRNGIAVLRYDDRGVGGSSGNVAQSTSADFAADVLAAVELLKGRQDIDPQHIGLLGHSEGGIVAPMTAVQSQDIAMAILLAGPAMRGDEVIYTQLERIMQVEGVSEEEIQENLDQQHAIFDALLSGEGWEEEKAKLRERIVEQVEALPEAQKEALGDLDEYVDTVYEQQIASLESPWYRFFLEYDPVPTLEELTIPVLALFGGLDVQVIAEENKLLMEQALERGGNEDATLVIYPEANHIFQQAVTGSTSEYGGLEKAFIPGLLDEVTAWILERIE
jgi:pimeloyl-ACP methyl ester carboxylesterase